MGDMYVLYRILTLDHVKCAHQYWQGAFSGCE